MEAGIVWKKDGIYTAKLGSTVYLNQYVKQGDLSVSKTYGRVSLGDVQKCVMNILHLVMNTEAFADYLNKTSGTGDYVCEAWSSLYAEEMVNLVQVERSEAE